MKELVIYYSRNGENYGMNGIVNLEIGNTEIVANMIKEIKGADLFKVETIKEYPKDCYECTKLAREELDKNVRPELKAYLKDIDKYDIIYIGYPNWWGTMPMALIHQLEKLNFEGKIIKPFCTHESTGRGNSVNDLKLYCKGANVLKALCIHGSFVNESKEIVKKWLSLD